MLIWKTGTTSKRDS